MVLRLEDTDPERSTEEFERDIIGSLEWMGIDWDEGPLVGGEHGPYRQSDRMPLYREYAERLIADGRAYRCYCSPEELEQRRKSAISRGEAWRYDRHCLGLTPDQIGKLENDGVPSAVRFRVPKGTVEVNDMLRGKVTVDASEIDDFIIMRSDGRAGFHLAVVVDDITMEITHVIRGDDHLTNAVRHVLLFQALNRTPPLFLHHSLLMGPDGSKLSKRHGATAVSAYQEQGYLPQALVNYLALLSWSPGDEREIFTVPEIVSEFDLEGVSASKAVFDFDKLNWIDRQHIKRLTDGELTDMVVPFLEGAGKDSLLALPRGKLEVAVASVRKGMEKLVDAVEPMAVYSRPAGLLSTKAEEELRKSKELEEALEICIHELISHEGSDMETAELVVENLRGAAKERDWGAKSVLWPFRLAVTGLTVGPDLTYLIMFWEPAGCAERIRATIRTMGEAADGKS